jgi:hypothetical protein
MRTYWAARDGARLLGRNKIAKKVAFFGFGGAGNANSLIRELIPCSNFGFNLSARSEVTQIL